MSPRRTVRAGTVALLAAAAALSGCANRLTTAGSMTIDVEVYRGPLANEPEVQWRELAAIVRSGPALVEAMLTQIHESEKQLRCGKYLETNPVTNGSPPLIRSKPPADEDEQGDRNWKRSKNCIIFATLHSELRGLGRGASTLSHQFEYAATSADPVDPADSKAHLLLKDAAELAGAFRVLATSITFQMASVRPDVKRVRIDLIRAANTAAEFHNQLSSRVDTLLKQRGGTDRALLPLSVYLRDSSTTAFVNAYEWYDASVSGGQSTTARIRGVEQLFNDANWAHINTVYASGQGDVRMAFIKDDIGNWNLKSFDNDPTELVEAYKKLTLAGIEAATKVAAAPSGAGAAATLDLAGRLAGGRVGGADTRAAPDVSRLRDRTRRELSDLREWLPTRRAAIASERTQVESDLAAQEKLVDERKVAADEALAKVTDLKEQESAATGTDRSTLADQLANARREWARADRDLSDAKRQRDRLDSRRTALAEEARNLPDAAADRARGILDRYETMIDAIAETSAPPRRPAANPIDLGVLPGSGG